MYVHMYDNLRTVEAKFINYGCDLLIHPFDNDIHVTCL